MHMTMADVEKAASVADNYGATGDCAAYLIARYALHLAGFGDPTLKQVILMREALRKDDI